jgi:hypothetical protein
VLFEPLTASCPLHPPDAVHEVALVELQVRVEAPPGATEVGLAESVAVAAASTSTLTEATELVPPAPVQLNE